MGTAVGAEQTASRPDENRELTVRRGASAWILIQRNLRRLGLVLGLLGAGVVFLNIRNAGGPGLDLSAYLNASKANAYRVDVGSRDVFVYAPPFLQAMYPIQHVPVDVARMVFVPAGHLALKAPIPVLATVSASIEVHPDRSVVVGIRHRPSCG